MINSPLVVEKFWLVGREMRGVQISVVPVEVGREPGREGQRLDLRLTQT